MKGTPTVQASDASRTPIDAAIWVLIATAGNLVGGVGLVTLFRMVQARAKGHGT